MGYILASLSAALLLSISDLCANYALDNGSSIIDTSMLGMGRGAGNAITESVVAYLLREKYLKKIIRAMYVKKEAYILKNSAPRFLKKKVIFLNIHTKVLQKNYGNPMKLRKNIPIYVMLKMQLRNIILVLLREDQRTLRPMV
jgi:pyruvate/oxaloacetate carboxyltransferase